MQVPYKSFEELIAIWPSSAPLLAWKNRDGSFALVLRAREISADLFLGTTIGAGDGYAYAYLVSYDEYAGVNGGMPSRLFEIHAYLEGRDGVLQWVESSSLAGNYEISIDSKFLWESAIYDDSHHPEIGLELIGSFADYAESFAGVQNDIRDGRFYELNLLRSFHVSRPVFRRDIVALARRQKAPCYLLICDLSDLGLLSLSPERFAKLDFRAEKSVILEPIKGSGKDPAAFGRKEARELNMIIDLMRHELYQLAKPHAVFVRDPGSLSFHHYIYHLSARIEAFLRDDVCWGEFFRTLLPSGSITGAPKQEVMLAIAEYEPFRRGYAMGAFFFIDAKNRVMDSSVLIRTMYTLSPTEGVYTYFAGGAILIDSDLGAEWDEVLLKCGAMGKPMV